MLRRIISGGQTGADQAAWRAAEAVGLTTGGWMPCGFGTEDGPQPHLAARFGAVEHESAEPSARTVANVREADGTLVFADDHPSPGTALTIAACRAEGRPCRIVDPDRPIDVADPGRVADWIIAEGIETLNVAGDRESQRPGLGAKVEAYLARLFRLGL
jgi:hypothetical protein